MRCSADRVAHSGEPGVTRAGAACCAGAGAGAGELAAAGGAEDVGVVARVGMSGIYECSARGDRARGRWRVVLHGRILRSAPAQFSLGAKSGACLSASPRSVICEAKSIAFRNGSNPSGSATYQHNLLILLHFYIGCDCYLHFSAHLRPKLTDPCNNRPEDVPNKAIRAG
jgi:hypothetical protein